MWVRRGVNRVAKLQHGWLAGYGSCRSVHSVRNGFHHQEEWHRKNWIPAVLVIGGLGLFAGVHGVSEKEVVKLQAAQTQALAKAPPTEVTIRRRKSVIETIAKTDKELKQRYKLGQVLGEGTFAVVRLGIDKKNRDRVAIKEISKELSEREALENEVKIMEISGRHENIVSLRDVFDSKKTLYLVMDLAEGGELFDRIIERGELSEQTASKMFLSAVKGVHHLHSCHIAHLDLKPENLLLTSRNDDAGIKIADFGLAVDLSQYRECQKEDSNVTLECVGTPAYWSPEMVKNEPFDEKSDIWALGCVLYIMLCGAHPFDPNGDSTEAQILAQVATGNYDKTSPQYLVISENAKDLIRHMLDPNPKTRYDSEQLLHHPWLSESGKLSNRPLSKDHITRLRGFRIIRLLRQGLEHLAGKETQKLFDVFDTNGDGYLDKEELAKSLELVGQKCTKRELDQMLRMIDRDNDQRISREEFDLVLRAPPGSPYSSVRHHGTSLEDIEFLFRIFDRDQDGYITRDDFQHVLGVLGSSISSSAVDSKIAMVDKNNDGRVDLSEFVAYWRMMERERRKHHAYHSISPLQIKHRPHHSSNSQNEEDEASEFADMSH